MSLNPAEIAFQIVAFLFALSAHEAAHAWVADRCGDDTARQLGRVTLNPWPHIDLFGTIILPAMGIISGLPIIGWAKPTPVNPSRLRHPRRDDILVTIAGPASNLAIAIVCVALLVMIRVSTKDGASVVEQIATGYGDLLIRQSEGIVAPIALLLYNFLFINVLLAVFNMIPVPPLDGGQILGQLLPVSWQAGFRQLSRFGFMILVALLFLNVPYRLFEPVFWMFRVLLLN